MLNDRLNSQPLGELPRSEISDWISSAIRSKAEVNRDGLLISAYDCDLGIESSRVVGSACSCLAGEDSGGAGDARVASAVRKIGMPPILVGMPEKVVNNSYASYKANSSRLLVQVNHPSI